MKNALNKKKNKQTTIFVWFFVVPFIFCFNFILFFRFNFISVFYYLSLTRMRAAQFTQYQNYVLVCAHTLIQNTPTAQSTHARSICNLYSVCDLFMFQKLFWFFCFLIRSTTTKTTFTTRSSNFYGHQYI